MAQAGDLADTLWVQNDNGLELPAWAKPYFPDVLYGARVRAYQLYTETPYMRRIRGGPILTDIFKQMQQKQAGKLSREIAMYSAHDTTLNFLMNALNVIDQTTVMADYGASLALELHCEFDEECTVNVRRQPSISNSSNFINSFLIFLFANRWFTIGIRTVQRRSSFRFHIVRNPARSVVSKMRFVIIYSTISLKSVNFEILELVFTSCDFYFSTTL